MRFRKWIGMGLFALVTACSGTDCSSPSGPCGGSGQRPCTDKATGAPTCNAGFYYDRVSNKCRNDCGVTGKTCCDGAFGYDSGPICLDGSSCSSSRVCGGSSGTPAACGAGAHAYTCISADGCAQNAWLAASSLDAAKSCMASLGCARVEAHSAKERDVCWKSPGHEGLTVSLFADSDADALSCARKARGEGSTYTLGKCP